MGLHNSISDPWSKTLNIYFLKYLPTLCWNKVTIKKYFGISVISSQKILYLFPYTKHDKI